MSDPSTSCGRAEVEGRMMEALRPPPAWPAGWGTCHVFQRERAQQPDHTLHNGQITPPLAESIACNTRSGPIASELLAYAWFV